jgi:hypothetical protein
MKLTKIMNYLERPALPKDHNIATYLRSRKWRKGNREHKRGRERDMKAFRRQDLNI